MKQWSILWKSAEDFPCFLHVTWSFRIFLLRPLRRFTVTFGICIHPLSFLYSQGSLAFWPMYIFCKKSPHGHFLFLPATTIQDWKLLFHLILPSADILLSQFLLVVVHCAEQSLHCTGIDLQFVSTHRWRHATISSVCESPSHCLPLGMQLESTFRQHAILQRFWNGVIENSREQSVRTRCNASEEDWRYGKVSIM